MSSSTKELLLMEPARRVRPPFPSNRRLGGGAGSRTGYGRQVAGPLGAGWPGPAGWWRSDHPAHGGRASTSTTRLPVIASGWSAYAIANRWCATAITRHFIADGGYPSAELWLSEGWAGRAG